MNRKHSASYMSAGTAVAAFISALLLSLLLSLFYNAWKYEIERIELDVGGWQSRLVGEIDADALATIRNFAHVRDVTVGEGSVDIYFDDMGAVLRATPRLAEIARVPEEGVVYNRELLAMYLIRDPQDSAPRLVFPLFVLITLLASASLVIIIHNAFAVSMGARVHQLGILASVGATPRQIRARLLRDAATRCAPMVALGNLLGIGISAGLLPLANRLLGDSVAGRHEAVFGYHPLILAATLLLTIGTVFLCAWLPARKLSKLTPLEAIRGTGELELKRAKRSTLLGRLFGVEGMLAGAALRAQRRALRTASLSLTLAFLSFTLMQCFFCLSGISTRETYFERYQDVWDIMVTLKDAGVDDFSELDAIRRTPGVRDAVAYQRATAKRVVSEDEMSEAMASFGGFSHAGDEVSRTDGGWLVSAPVVILDDASFLRYCEQIGIAPALDGAVILNQIRDVTNPDFRHPLMLPYLKGEGEVSELLGEASARVPVLAYADEPPVLREEYAKLDYYELVHFMPASLWKQVGEALGGAAQDSFVRVLGPKGATLEELNALQGEIDALLAPRYRVQSENRLQEAEANDIVIQGMRALFGGFCALLAMIGIGNVFSNALGFVRQRRREFGRYMSLGMTPGEFRKMFCVEALALAGRPALIALPLSAIAVGLMLKASYVAPGEFLAEAPILPVALMMLAILASVSLAYAISWRSIRKLTLSEILRDDTLL